MFNIPESNLKIYTFNTYTQKIVKKQKILCCFYYSLLLRAVGIHKGQGELLTIFFNNHTAYKDQVNLFKL